MDPHKKELHNYIRYEGYLMDKLNKKDFIRGQGIKIKKEIQRARKKINYLLQDTTEQIMGRYSSI